MVPGASSYVSCDGDAIGARVGRLRLRDDVVGVRQVDRAIQAGNNLVASWALLHGGELIEAGGDEVAVRVPDEALPGLADVRRQYAVLVGATLSCGIGRRLSESSKALFAAKARGKDRVVLYDASVEREARAAAQREATVDAVTKESKEYFGKSEAVPGRDYAALFHRHAQAQDSRDRAVAARRSVDLDGMRSRVEAALHHVRAHAETYQGLEQASPGAYAAVVDLVNVIEDLARGLHTADARIAKAETAGDEVRRLLAQLA